MNQVQGEYNDRIKEASDNHFMRLRAAEWLLDANQRIVQKSHDENQEVLENAVRNQANSAQLLAHYKWI